MAEEISRISEKANAVEIPICVDTNVFRPDNEARARRRDELGLNSRKIIAYQGSLGLLNRNIVEVTEYLGFMRCLIPDLCF